MATMENKVYYGEYSLKHWIDLMLTRNIELPEYQRHFVWQERDIERLIKSLKEKQFVQPVTIALYPIEGEKKNLILDGQQRLTSILLAYIGYLPDRKKFMEGDIEDTTLADEDDSTLDDTEEGITTRRSILWKFDELLRDKNSKEDIVNQIKSDDRYTPLTGAVFTDLNNDFFENTFMGFSYIIPESTVQTEVQDIFSKLFRNINYFGKKLNAMESRKSLYFQNMELVRYFEGKTDEDKDVLCGIRIIENLQPYKIDFVRYLSILSQYMANKCDESKVLVGYSAFSSRESFYADYVSHVLGQGPNEQESRPEKFESFIFADVFHENCWHERFNNLRQTLERIKPNMGLDGRNAFKTWVEADYWLFGLIYHVVFEGKSLNETLSRKEGEGTVTLSDELSAKIEEKKKDENNYMKNTNRIGNLRERLKESYEIYARYV